MTGRVHSIQSLGAADGPGIRFVLFLQGCNLRCGYCHNPDTQSVKGGVEYSAEEIVKKSTRYREYFGTEGGITVSGGEPLLQAAFVREVFALARAEGINTCLDTSGCIMNDEVEALLSVTDRVLLDVKFPTDEQYKKFVGCSRSAPLRFLEALEKRGIKTTLRRVIVPSLNDSEESVLDLAKIRRTHSCVDKIELLPFRKLCSVKYDTLGIPFPFKDYPEPSPEKMRDIEALLTT